jgi:hypothetical protein
MISIEYRVSIAHFRRVGWGRELLGSPPGAYIIKLFKAIINNVV